MAPKRRLAAIMFTDVVGFTAATHADEDRALARLEEQERRIRPILRRHGGREVKTIGDSFLVEFRSALEACRCAVEIQRAPAERLVLRIGIHVGDVVQKGTDVVGDAVNIASRIEHLAEPGGVWVSQQVVDQVAHRFDVPFVRRPGAVLKGVSRAVALYAMELGGARAATEPSTPPAAAPARRRLAVLPMANLTPEPELEYLADGFTEELILRLAKVPGFHVLARTTVQRFKGATKSPAEIARELGVEAILEGSVRAHGSRLRITTTLIDPQREEPLWSEGYDRTLTDLFAVQSEIAERTALALSVRLSGEVRAVVGRPLTQNEGAYAAYLRGRFYWNRRTQESLVQAIGEYRGALALDPRLALAHAGVADAYAALALLEHERPDVAFPSARAAAEAAIALDPGCAEAYTSLGVVRFQYDRDWSGSEEAFRRALALNPSYAPAHHQFADLLKALGRFDEALAEIRQALDLDPLSLAINTGVGHVLYLARRYDEAIAQYRRTLELDPTFVQAHLWFGRPYLEKGMFAEAIAELEQAARISHESTISLAVLAHAYAAAGRRDDALGIVGRLLDRARTTYVPSYWIGLVYVGLGDADRAFLWLERARAEHSSWLTWVLVEPRFDGLRDDRRFRRLLTEMHLPAHPPGAAVRPKGRVRPPARYRARPARASPARARGRATTRSSAASRPPQTAPATRRKPRK